MINDKCIENIIHKYFQQDDILTAHQIESYDNFIDNILPQIISQFFPLELEYFGHSKINKLSISIKNISVEKPFYTENNGCSKIMTPNIARLRNFTYSLSILIDLIITIEINDNDNKIILPDKIINNILLAKVPLIIKSKYCNYKKDINSECRYDTGGYFIINGNEKVLISQEKIAPNIIQVHSVIKNSSKYGYISEIRSTNENTYGICKTISIKLTNKPNIYNNRLYISIPHIKQDIPLFIIFRALGCISDKESIYFIIDNDKSEIDKNIMKILYNSLLDISEYNSERDAIKYISKYVNNNNSSFSTEMRMNYCLNIIKKEYLPHLNDNLSKLYFTGLMVNKLLKSYLGINCTCDRDSYYNKRIETSGNLLGNLIIQSMGKIIKDMKTQINKEVNSGIWSITDNYNDIINDININKIIKHNYIENILKGALATGNWGLKNNINKQGVSQVLNRLTFMSTLSHLRRVSTPVDNTGKLIPPRKLHSSQWGYICPTETPEGQSVGVVKNLSMMCEITKYNSSIIIRKYIEGFIIHFNELNIFEYNKLDYIKVFINGNWIGYTLDHKLLIDTFKKERNKCNIHPHNSIYWNVEDNSIYIFTDSGRCTRPLIRVDKMKNISLKQINNLKWSELFLPNNQNILEYIDVCEINNCLVLMEKKKYKKNTNYTHCEIDPCLILGALASCIPFLNHNQSPRNTYQSAMGKQAIGLHTTNINQRYDTFSHTLYYPQKPLINTKIMKYFNFNSMPNGVNAIVAIATYTGYNQEDSVIINQGAIDRGLFSSTFYRTYKSEEEKNQLTGEEDIFCSPNTNELLFPKPCNYSKLESNGFVKPNTKINENDIIIGKVMPIKNNPNYKYRDSSTCIKNNETGYIDSNYIGINGEGYRFCKVKIRSSRIPEIGDKVSSRHGQKGTIGMTYPHEDMPFTKEGIVPDIIINPHAVPSRMTIAQLIECILGKSCSLLGYEGDGTGFNNTNIEDIIKVLENQGFEGMGNEVLYGGNNGEQMKTSIFMGPTYYQRLKHMSGDKVHSRASGPIVAMTRQPSEGRSNHGGLRFGEMERDCMIAHGASFFLKERMIDVSDKFSVYICDKCKLFCTGNKEQQLFECKKCKNFSNFSKIYIPYACKLLLQELICMGIGPRLLTN